MNLELSLSTASTNKWILTQEILKGTKTLEVILNVIFSAAMLRLERVTNNKFQTPMKERIWKKVSIEKLEIVEQNLVSAISDYFFKNCRDEEVAEMLKQYRKEGRIEDGKGKIDLRCDQDLSNNILKICKPAAEAWMPEISEAVKDEGIILPEGGVSFDW